MLLRELYMEWAMDYCNNYFDEDNIPAGFKLAVDNLVELDPLEFGVSSHKLNDMSVTYSDNSESGIPAHILKWLEPYRRLKSV